MTPLAGKRLLVVAENAELAELLAGAAAGLGAEVEARTSAGGAYEALRGRPPDLAVVDLPLPDATGEEILGALRTAGVPAIGVSGVHRGARGAEEARRIGAAEFFEKPFAVDALMAAAARLLGASAPAAAAPVDLTETLPFAEIVEEIADEDILEPDAEIPREPVVELPLAPPPAPTAPPQRPSATPSSSPAPPEPPAAVDPASTTAPPTQEPAPIPELPVPAPPAPEQPLLPARASGAPEESRETPVALPAGDEPAPCAEEGPAAAPAAPAAPVEPRGASPAPPEAAPRAAPPPADRPPPSGAATPRPAGQERRSSPPPLRTPPSTPVRPVPSAPATSAFPAPPARPRPPPPPRPARAPVTDGLASPLPGAAPIRPSRAEAPPRRTGDLSKSSVPRLLVALHVAQATGALRLSRGGVRKLVVVERGVPVYAVSNVAAERLGAICVRRGVVAQEALDALRGERPDATTADLLAGAGLLGPERRAELVAGQVRAIVWSTFGWTEGSYAFEPARPPEGHVRLSIGMGDLVLQGILRTASLERLHAELPANAHLAPSPDPAFELYALGLDPNQARLLSVADGTKSVADLLKLSDLPERETLAFLAACRVMRVLDEVERVLASTRRMGFM